MDLFGVLGLHGFNSYKLEEKLEQILNLISDDSYASKFQTIRQYREALIESLKENS